MGKKAHRRYVGTIGKVGPKGSGKSYELVKKAIRTRHQRFWDETTNSERPWHVVTNRLFDVLDPITGRTLPQLSSIAELVSVPRGTVILCDEISSLFNARDWKHFPTAVFHRLKTARKGDIEFHWSDVHEDFVDKQIRELTDWFDQCHRVPDIPLLGSYYVVSRWAPKEFRKANEKPRWRDWNKLSEKVWRHYITKQEATVPRQVWEAVRDANAEEWRSISEWADLDGVKLNGIWSDGGRVPEGAPPSAAPDSNALLLCGSASAQTLRKSSPARSLVTFFTNIAGNIGG